MEAEFKPTQRFVPALVKIFLKRPKLVILPWKVSFQPFQLVFQPYFNTVETNIKMFVYVPYSITITFGFDF